MRIPRKMTFDTPCPVAKLSNQLPSEPMSRLGIEPPRSASAELQTAVRHEQMRMILEHLGISKFFRHVFLSSELGADKPDPLIYRRALEISGFEADAVVHVGDDPVRDWKGAEAAGLRVFELGRPQVSLRNLPAFLESGGLRGDSE